MIEAYKIGAALTMTTNVVPEMAKIAQEFESFDRLIKGAQKNIQNYAKELASIGRAGGGVNNLIKSLTRLSELKVAPNAVSGMEKVAGLTARIAAEQQAIARAASETALAWRATAAEMAAASHGGGGRGPGGPPSPGQPTPGGKAPRSGGHDYLMAGIGLSMAGSAGMSYFEKAFMAEAEVEHLMNSLRMNTKINEGDVAKARTLAERIARDTPGTKIAENLKIINDAFTITADIHEAMAAAPQMAKLGLVLASLPGAHHGDSGFAAAQAVEVMQRMYDPQTHQIDMAAFNKQIAAMTQVAVGTGGRDTPQMYLAMAKQARMAGMLANDQFLYRDLPAMQIALGGNRTGTGMAAIWRQLGMGRMTQNAAEELQKIGVLDKGAEWSHGRVLDIDKHLHGFKTLSENMVQWTRDYLLKDLAAHGVNVNDRAALGNAAGKFASTNVALGFLGEMLLGMTGINKEGQKIEATTNDPMSVLKNDPLQKLREFHAAENELLVTLGSAMMGPAIETLKAFTGALRGLSDWAKEHPGTAKFLTEVAAAASAVSVALGGLLTTLFFAAAALKVLKIVAPAGAAAAGAAGAGEAAAAGAGVAASRATIGLAGVGALTLPLALSGDTSAGPHPKEPMTSWLGQGGAVEQWVRKKIEQLADAAIRLPGAGMGGVGLGISSPANAAARWGVEPSAPGPRAPVGTKSLDLPWLNAPSGPTPVTIVPGANVQPIRSEITPENAHSVADTIAQAVRAALAGMGISVNLDGRKIAEGIFGGAPGPRIPSGPTGFNPRDQPSYPGIPAGL